MGWSRIWNPIPEPKLQLPPGEIYSARPNSLGWYRDWALNLLETTLSTPGAPQQQVRPRKRQQTARPGRPSRVDWDGYVWQKAYDRFEELGLPHPNDPNPKWRRQAHAEGWVGRLRVPTGEGEGTDQIKNLAAESTIRDHVVQFMKEYATEMGWVYDEQQKGWTRISVKAGK